MFHLHFSGDIPACSPSIRSRLHFWNLSDIARWLLRLLPHQFRFKNLFFFSFFTMYIMHIFYYTGQWPYYHQHLFPTLNGHLYPAPKYGTNPKASDRTIRILPMPLLMLYTFLHLTLMKRKPSWMICCSTIFQSHINMLLPRHRMPFQILRSSPRRHRHLRNASRRPKQLPKHLQSAVAFKTSRDPGLLALWPLGLQKKNKNFGLWNPMRDPGFHGVWFQPRWAKPKRTFDQCGTSSRTRLANYLRLVSIRKKDLPPERFTTSDIMLC